MIFKKEPDFNVTARDILLYQYPKHEMYILGINGKTLPQVDVFVMEGCLLLFACGQYVYLLVNICTKVYVCLYRSIYYQFNTAV